VTHEIDTFLSQQDVPGVVAMGFNSGDVLYAGAFGQANVQAGTAMTLQTPHAIMSMTKPLTSMAAMMLVEQGKLALDTPARDYVPAYADMQVLAGQTPTGEPIWAAAEQPFTIRHLLTNLAGFGYAFCNTALAAHLPASNYKRFGLVHQPGAQWTYGISTQVLGEVIVAVTGQPLSQVFKSLIFEPLGMAATSYDLQPDMAVPHVKVNGAWQAQGTMAAPEKGDAGLISTAGDYSRFLQCLLQGGAPLVDTATLQAMTSNQIGDLCIQQQPAANPALTHPFPRGGGVDKFGFGFQLHQQGQPGMRSVGSYSWCGLLNTYFWVDPLRQLGGVVLMQVLPLFDPTCLQTLDGFERHLYRLQP
jgi:methyl acetate hydrolase